MMQIQATSQILTDDYLLSSTRIYLYPRAAVLQGLAITVTSEVCSWTPTPQGLTVPHTALTGLMKEQI
jgi:hypothetical protein